MKRHLKLLVAIVVAAVSAIGFTSCAVEDFIPDTDFIPHTETGFYMDTTCSGGGLSTAELKEFRQSMDEELDLYVNDYLLECNKSEAIDYFDAFVKEYRVQMSGGIYGLEQDLKITFHLRTLSGSKIKSTTVRITDKSCYIE